MKALVPRENVPRVRSRSSGKARNAASIGSRRSSASSPACFTSSSWRGSRDEVGLVRHAAGSAGADADEHALVQPVECRGGGLDLRRGAERVRARVDVFAAAETGKHVGGAMTDTA